MAKSYALLLTDVVDSTRLTERLGDTAIGELWCAHDRVARDLLPQWHGREIDKTDGMLLLFEDVDDAIGYALAYHRAIEADDLPIKVRAGIHFGAVTLRANTVEDVARGAKPIEVIGLALPMVARVMSVALGGQTLLSAGARLATGVTPQRLHSHGHWRLQGVADPVELFEIGETGTQFRVPEDGAKAYRVLRQGELWLPVREVRHSMPAERDSFVGRQEPLQLLAKKLEAGARLVSVVGVGGTGKTRLVTHFAWSWLGDYPGGVWFCDLSQARSLDGIHFAVAKGLEVQLGIADPVAQLAKAIAGRGKCLVILDNFEQVASHAEETLGCWLDRAPFAQFIVTTREVLGIIGEETFALAPLAGEDAVELFVRRGQAARQGYAPSADDLLAIEQLVKVLDGLPLAIELAAARVRVMPPRTLVGRVRDRFDLIGVRAGRRDRQATLRTAFDWSWDLLIDFEKVALASLSVFEGGFTIDSAAAVLAPADVSSHEVIDAVQGLVDKSFVRQVDDDRFDLLETVREYAGRQLIAENRFPGSGPDCAAAARTRHWQYFAALDERAAIAHRCIEANNLVAACRAAARAGDAPAASACAAVAWSSLRLTGPYRVAVELAQLVAALPSLKDSERALVHWVAGDALELLGDVESARSNLQRGLACASRAQEPGITARLLVALGNRQTLDGDLDQARLSLEQAHRLAIILQDSEMQMRALNALGLHNDHQSRWTEAQGYYEEALALARSLGDRRMEGGLLGNLGGLHHDMGDLQAAQAQYESALQLANEQGDRRWEGNARCNLGLLYQEQERRDEARNQFEIALDMARQVGHIRLEYTVLCNLGILLAGEGQLVGAGQHFQQAVEAAVSCSDRRAEGQFRAYLALNQARRGLLDDARTSLAIGERLLRTMSDRLSHALLLCDRAEVELLARCETAARQAFVEARRLAEVRGLDAVRYCLETLLLDRGAVTRQSSAYRGKGC